jgi:hypothetical protein
MPPRKQPPQQNPEEEDDDLVSADFVAKIGFGEDSMP